MDCSICGQNDRDAYRILTETEMEIRMRIIGGAIILVIAVWLYVVSTRMVNKDKKENHTGCDGNCAGCMSGCMTHTDNDKSH